MKISGENRAAGGVRARVLLIGVIDHSFAVESNWKHQEETVNLERHTYRHYLAQPLFIPQPHSMFFLACP